MKEAYVDGTALLRQNGAVGVGIILGEPCRTIICGCRVYSMPGSDRERAYDILRECCGVGFIFDGDNVAPEIYAVPEIMIFAQDGGGGYFYSTDMGMDISRDDAPIYLINARHDCKYVAPNLRALIEMAVFDAGFCARNGVKNPTRIISAEERNYLIERLNLRAPRMSCMQKWQNPAHDVRIFENKEQAETQIEFTRLPDNVISD